MNSWNLIKEYFTKDSRPGSMGYLSDLKKAAFLFIKMRDQLKDFSDAVVVFNNDNEVRISLLTPDLEDLL